MSHTSPHISKDEITDLLLLPIIVIMAGPMSLQDQVSPMFLTTQGFPRYSRKKIFSFGHI